MSIKTHFSQFLRLIFIFAVFLALYSCSSESDVEVASAEVKLKISLPEWSNNDARATNDMLYPINILLLTGDNDDISKHITLVHGTELSTSIPANTYEVYAVCGLPTELIPKILSQEISIPTLDDGSVIDFAVGHTSVDVSSSTQISITAKRQTSWLDLTVTDVPSKITNVTVYANGLRNAYALDEGWSTKKEQSVRIPLTPSTSGTFEGNALVPPSIGASGMTYTIEATTADGRTIYYTYTSNKPLTMGTHLRQSISLQQMTFMDGEVSVDGWNTESANGNVVGLQSFSIGERFLSFPATVYFYNDKQLVLFPYEPLTVTLAEVRSWADYNNVPYAGCPNLPVSSYRLATSKGAPSNLIAMLMNGGLAKLNQQIAESGHTPIDANATNILAYYDVNTDTFYRYDFPSFSFAKASEDADEEFLLYPSGIISLMQ